MSIPLNFGCHNRASGMACRYCAKTWGKPNQDPLGSAARKATARQNEWVIGAANRPAPVTAKLVDMGNQNLIN